MGSAQCEPRSSSETRQKLPDGVQALPGRDVPDAPVAKSSQ